MALACLPPPSRPRMPGSAARPTPVTVPTGGLPAVLPPDGSPEPGCPFAMRASSSRASSAWRRARSRSRVSRSISAASLAGETSIAAARCWARVCLSMNFELRSVVQVIHELVHEPGYEAHRPNGLGIGKPGRPEHPDDADSAIHAPVRCEDECHLAHVRRLVLVTDEDLDDARFGNAADEATEVRPVLERGEDAAQLLAVSELGRAHHIEEAVAEDLLDGGAVVVPEQPHDALPDAGNEL